MSEIRPATAHLEGMDPYDPNYLPAEVQLSANENPYGLPEQVKDAILARLRDLPYNRYPDPLANELRDALASEAGLQRDEVLVGNGGDELIFDILLSWGGPQRTLLTCPPTFSAYETDAHLTGTDIVRVARHEDFGIDTDAVCERLAAGGVDLVILTTPNNPTGNAISIADIERVLCATDAPVLVDEAYGEFAGCSSLRLFADHPNLVILHTFSKAYAAAGVRLGYLFAHDQVVDELKKVRQPYSVDALSQAIGSEIVRMRTAFQPSIARIISERGRLAAGLLAMDDVEVYPSEANFLLVRLPQAKRVWERLYQEHSVLVRDFSEDPQLAGCLRITVGTEEENARLLEALRCCLEEL